MKKVTRRMWIVGAMTILAGKCFGGVHKVEPKGVMLRNKNVKFAKKNYNSHGQLQARLELVEQMLGLREIDE